MAKKPTKAKPNKGKPRKAPKSAAKATPKAKPAASKAPKQPSGPNFFQKHATWLRPVSIIGGFLVLLLIYFSPVLSGDSLQMSDIQAFAGMSKEVRDYKEATGEQAFWTGRMFSGMPTFHTGMAYPNNWFKNIAAIYFRSIPAPVSFILMVFLGFFLMLRALKVDYAMSALGGLAFAFSSYFFIIMAAGHTSKTAAIAFMSPLVAGVIMAYRGQMLWGALLAALGLAFQLAANHLQITYYTGILLVILGVGFLVDAIRQKTIPQFAKATAALLIAAAVGAGPGLGLILTNAEYAEETTRGPSELTPADGGAKSDGLDIGYAFDWSFEQAEVFTTLIPNLYGGASATPLNRSYEGADVLRRAYGGKVAPSYWGDQRFTSGPVYVGAGIFFLFVLGLLLVKGPIKWALLVATILSAMLSMGDHLLGFNQLVFETLPYYNKFRAVAMTLVIAEFTMPLLGILALLRVAQPEKYELDTDQLTRNLYIAAGVTGGLCLMFWLLGGSLFDFEGTGDARILNGDLPDAQKTLMMNALHDYRLDMLKADALRSLAFVLATAAILWAWIQQRIKQPVAIGLLIAFTLVDMWVVNKRYLNDDNFAKQDNYGEKAPTPADQFILEDQEAHFRVLNLTGDIFNSATTAYFHKDIGGYHPAKLGRYNELIQQHISPEINQVVGALRQQNPTPASIQRSFAGVSTLNMLNLKYLIINPQGAPIENPSRFGPVWFVNRYQIVANADEEIETLGKINPRQVALIDQRYEDQLKGMTISPDSTATIQLAPGGYSPNVMKYTSQAASDQVAIFSEIYYNEEKGWNAYIDGQKVPHFRTDYVLRGLVVPAGSHEIEFRMEPQTYFLGETISLISSILLVLALAGVAFLSWRNSRQEATYPEDEPEA